MSRNAPAKNPTPGNYKDSLLLPKTAFPMKAKLAEKEPEISPENQPTADSDDDVVAEIRTEVKS